MGMGIKGRCRRLAERLPVTLSEMSGRHDPRTNKVGLPSYYVHLVKHPYIFNQKGGGRWGCLPQISRFDSWEGVWEFLQMVRVDLMFHKCGVSVPDTKAILQACEGEGEILFADWTSHENTDAGLILCDWLQDQGLDGPAESLRTGLMKLLTVPT